MAFTKKYSIWAIQLDKTSDVILGAITRSRLALDPTVRSDPTSGEVYPRHQAVVARRPMANFTTLDLHTALTEIALTGLYVNGVGATVEALNLFCVPHAAGSTRQSGSVNRRYNIVKAMVVPRRLFVEFGGDAQLDVDIIVLYDGGVNEAVIVADSVALPSGIADANRFTLGTVTLANIALTQVRSLEIDFGVGVVPEGADSDIYPVFASIQTIRPRLTLRGADPEWLKSSNIPVVGIAGTHANSTIFLRKRAQTGASYVADATAEHIKLTVAGMVQVTQAFDGPGDGSVETVVTLDGKYDGTNNPVVVALSQAIP